LPGTIVSFGFSVGLPVYGIFCPAGAGDSVVVELVVVEGVLVDGAVVVVGDVEEVGRGALTADVVGDGHACPVDSSSGTSEVVGALSLAGAHGAADGDVTVGVVGSAPAIGEEVITILTAAAAVMKSAAFLLIVATPPRFPFSLRIE